MPEFDMRVTTDVAEMTDEQLAAVVDELDYMAAVPSMLDNHLSVHLTVKAGGPGAGILAANMAEVAVRVLLEDLGHPAAAVQVAPS